MLYNIILLKTPISKKTTGNIYGRFKGIEKDHGKQNSAKRYDYKKTL